MPAAQRAFPCIWTTWLTNLLTGESSCEWAAWFRAHHQGWERPPNDFNLSQWQMDHTALLNDTRRKFEDSGYDVRVEAQNAFRLEGRTATLAGQPGLIIPTSDHILIVDAKTGVERASHTAQVMVYMYACRAPWSNTGAPASRARSTTQPHPARATGRREPRVYPPPHHADSPCGGARPAILDAQRARVPVLRHKRRGLPRTGGRRLRA